MGSNSLTHPQASCRKQEQRWVIAFAIIAMFITTIPYILGYEFQGDEWRFSGFVFGIEDGNTYLAKMLRGAQGDWLFRTPFTTSEQEGIFAFFPYLILGKLTGGVNQHDQLVVLYHLFRIIGGFLAILAVYDFSALFIISGRLRKIAVVLITFGGGLGWVLVLLGKKTWLGSLPIDFYSPETFGFLGTFGIAHLTWSRAFLLWGLRAYLLRGSDKKDEFMPLCKIANLHSGILWLLTGISHPITGMVIGVIAGYHLIGIYFWQVVKFWKSRQADWIIVKRYSMNALVSGLVALPLVVYYFLVSGLDPFVKAWMEQSQVPPPHILHYIVAYGLVLPFMIVGCFVILCKPNPKGILLLSWVGMSPILLSIPFSQNRRLVEGLWVVLILLALVAFESIKNINFKRSYAILGFSFITTIFILVGSIMVVLKPNEPVFRPVDEIAAFNHLSEITNDSDVILSAYITGNNLPTWAPVFVLVGHRPESAGIKYLTPRIEAFFQDETMNETRITLLIQLDVDYVFWGPAERSFGDWKPTTASYLECVFNNGDYYIFKVLTTDRKSKS